MSELSFSNISKYYEKSGIKVCALESVSFSVQTSEVVALIGRNGAGKTTALKICTGFLEGYSGKILFDGEEDTLAQQNSSVLSYIPDTPVYYEFMSLIENLRFVDALYPKASDYSIEYLVSLFDLNDHLNKMPNQLSKGTKQKMSIIMALLRDYQILLADEPFSGLDPEQISNLKNLFKELSDKGKGVLISTHLLDVVESFCDRYVILNNAGIVASGTKEQLQKSIRSDAQSLESIFLKITSQEI